MAQRGARRVVLLTLGWADLPATVSLYGDTSGRRLREPVPGVLVQSSEGWVLLDTGYNPALLRDPPLYRRFHGRDHGVVPLLPGPGDPLETSLAEAGVSMDEVVAVGISHLHYDHAGGIRHFAGLGVPVHLQRRELEYGLSEHPGPERNGMFRVDYDDVEVNWSLADGDREVVPGVTAISTPGHTPGHQSFLVELDDEVGGGGLVFAFDAADLTENIEDEVPVGGFIDCTPEDTLESIRRLKALAAEKHYRLVPGHDPVAWPTLSQELAERFPAPG
jgi:glyoxylase-like metal-dependent hydrolase (beta-lactamase superfamily II)